MKKIMILIQNDCAYFSKYNREINKDDLNNTNIINVKNLKFTDEYIVENMDLISSFLNLMFIKFKIDKVVIKNSDIAEVILTVLNKLSVIKQVVFTEDSQLTYSICSLLLENNSLEKIECHSIPSIFFYKFSQNKIETRCEINSVSNFVKINKITTLSDVFYKNSIIISKELTNFDMYDIASFFDYNKNLKRIEFETYNEEQLKNILFYIKKNNLKNVTISINQNDNNENELKDNINLFKGLNKNYNVNIRIKYSKEYIKKNRIKELNLVLLRNIVICSFLFIIITMILYEAILNKDNTSTENNIDDINNKINEIIQDNMNDSNNEELISNEDNNNYVSPYYKNHSKVYNELLELNNETIGWISVNNTNINYPVVQTKDNDYYLNHSYDKSKNICGWIYVDYRCDMLNISKNTIIYGHNVANSNLLFSTLLNVIDENWYNNQENLNIKFSIRDQELNWRIFSIYIVEETSDYLYTDFNTDNDYLVFLEKIKNRSINNFNVELNANDKILTLSTCYKDNKRLVVHAKLVN